MGIPLKYWVIALICWVISGTCLYLMFILTPVEVDLVLSVLSIMTSFFSVASLLIGATRRGIELLRSTLENRLDKLENTIREGLELLKRLITEFRSFRNR